LRIHYEQQQKPFIWGGGLYVLRGLRAAAHARLACGAGRACAIQTDGSGRCRGLPGFLEVGPAPAFACVGGDLPEWALPPAYWRSEASGCKKEWARAQREGNDV
jgi:hypothetical protein